MKIGVAREIKPDEYRVALTPAGGRELVQRGHDVLVETGAGEGSSFSDDVYEAVGARVVTVDEVWETSELLLKVKEPIESEYRRLRWARALHVSPHRRRRAARAGARGQRNRGRRVRDGRDRQRRAAAPGSDERDRRPSSGPGGRVLPRETAWRSGAAAR